jgi:hypothetical protein
MSSALVARWGLTGRVSSCNALIAGHSLQHMLPLLPPPSPVRLHGRHVINGGEYLICLFSTICLLAFFCMLACSVY